MTYKEMVREMCGYEVFTTFFEDFTIAEIWGEEGVKETFKCAFKGWKHDYKYITELAMVMSHKSCMLYEKKPNLAQLYSELYYRICDWADGNLKEEEARYFFTTLD